MKNYLHISSSVVVRNGKASHNGKVMFESQLSDVAAFSKEFYKILKTDYSKFYKMDNLCKLAFVASELLLRENPLTSGYQQDKVALVFSNAGASLDTDQAYFNSVEDRNNYFPSPAVFVYTLPNIMMGEICIRHKFLGENIFFISEKFDAALLADYATHLVNDHKADCVISGWVEINERDWEAVLFLAEKSGSENLGSELSADTLNRIYEASA